MGAMRMMRILIAAVITVLLSGGAPAVAKEGTRSADSEQAVKGNISATVNPGDIKKGRQETLETVDKSKPEKLIWAGQSGDFAIRWTTADIQARPLKKPDRIMFSALQLARLGFQTFVSPSRLLGNEERITYERKFTMVSMVGSIMSLRDELYYEIRPSAHPGLEVRFTAIDLGKPGEVPDPWASEEGVNLAKPGKVVRLTDLFPGKYLLRALLADPIIREYTGEPGNPQAPKNLEDLCKVLKDQRPDLFPKDFLTRFAFHHVQGDKVAVRLMLLSGGGAARGSTFELGLLLPIPKAMRQPLRLAASGQAGFLMKDVKRISRGQNTEVVFEVNNVTVRKGQGPRSNLPRIGQQHSLDKPPQKKENLTFEDRQAWQKILNWPEPCGHDPEDLAGLPPENSSGLRFWQLEPKKYLVEVTCMTSAYNNLVLFIFYDETTSPPSSQVVSFEEYDQLAKTIRAPSEPELLGYTEVHPQTKELTLWGRARGLGDCGMWFKYRITANKGILLEVRAKECVDDPNYDGIAPEPATYPLIFRRPAKFKE
jgi:hypothetical protein